MKPNDELTYELIKDRLDQQIASVDAFIARASLVLATCGIIFTAYVQLLSLHHWLSSGGIVFSVFEIISLLIAGYFAFSALVIGGEKQYWRYPDPEKLNQLLAKNPSDFSRQVIDSMIKAFEHNDDVFRKKFDSLKNARIALYVSGSIFALHLIIFLILCYV